MTSPSGGGAEKDDEFSRSATGSAAGEDEALRQPTGLTALKQGRASLRKALPRRAPSSRRAMMEVMLA